MMSQTIRKSYRIARRAGQQGARHSAGDQADGEKCATGTNATHPQASVDQLSEVFLQPAAHDVKLTTNENESKRKKWTREEYKQVMEAYITASSGESNTKQTFTLWRNANPTSRPNMDPNKLSNVRRDIIKQKRLTDAEVEAIRRKVRHTVEGNENTVEDGRPEEQEDKIRNEEDQPQQQEVDGMTELGTNRTYEEHTDVEKVRDSILQKWMEVKHQGLENRDKLPKIYSNKNIKNLISLANRAIQNIKQDYSKPMDLTSINEICYAAATVITDLSCAKKIKKQGKRKQPKWKTDIEKDILKNRKNLSLLTEMEKGNITNKRKKRQMKKRYDIQDTTDIVEAKEKLKQQIQAKAQRIRRYEKRSKHFRHNHVFKVDPKKFYRELDKKQIEIKELPSLEKVEEFWSNVWEKQKNHNETAQWIKEEAGRLKSRPVQEWTNISKTEVILALKKANNWKSPGEDKVHNFWLKHLEVIHEDLAREYTEIIKTPIKSPTWLTQGLTYLLPKTNDTKNPKNYRPITCLPTMYKILTSIITERTYTFLDNNNMLPPEQKGCKRGSYGSKDQLLINKMILEDSKGKKKNLSTAWIDYRKAFESVPHSWIMKVMELHRISPTLITFMKTSMESWRTTMMLTYDERSIKTRPIKVSCGIFQGDSLSPLLFCLCLAPLSTMLNNSEHGYEVQGKKINHLFYMDDLKTYAKNDNQQEGLLQIVKLFSDDICMQFGLDKCAKVTFKKGKLTSTSNIQLDQETVIMELNQQDTYIYLGVNEGGGIQCATMK
uniref:Reverse transcriptase domain-containing protein n=1 Tax=Nothobranchius furzeri TaxID=105023 RepID=A0A8C6P0Q3_NOTFU